MLYGVYASSQTDRESQVRTLELLSFLNLFEKLNLYHEVLGEGNLTRKHHITTNLRSNLIMCVYKNAART